MGRFATMLVLMRVIKVASIVVLYSLCVSALCQSSVPTSQRSDKLADEQDIKEAVFRYQFEHNGSGLQKNAKVYFLSLNQGRDPSDDFMNRFRDHVPPVRKVSQASMSAEGVIDKRTRERGLLFRITGGVQWLSENEVEVAGGYFESGQSASRSVYNVRRVNDKWAVQKEKIKRVS